MFNVDGMNITLSVGDTGSVKFATSGYTFTANDAILFTVKDASNGIVFEKVFTNKTGISNVDPIESDGTFTVYFHNDDTDSRSAGSYTWDVRFVLGAYFNEAGKLTDGDQVITPVEPQVLTLLPVVGNV